MAGRDRQQRDWEDLAAFDPCRAILREPGRTEPWQLEEFLATGERDADRTLGTARAHGLPRKFARALDFGCGVGRVTLALARRFDEVVGIDISPTMIARARAIAAGTPNCRFVVGGEGELRALPSGHFDFVLSLLVLQHLPTPDEVERAVTELMRALVPGGALVLQAPPRLPLRRRIQSRRRAYALLRSLGMPSGVLLGRLRLDPIRTTALPEARVAAAARRAGGTILATEADDATGPHVPSRRYLITRV
jgi:SAM-dependent methyltransferase